MTDQLTQEKNKSNRASEAQKKAENERDESKKRLDECKEKIKKVEDALVPSGGNPTGGNTSSGGNNPNAATGAIRPPKKNAKGNNNKIPVTSAPVDAGKVGNENNSS